MTTYLAGVICLAGMAVTSAWPLIDALRQRARIVAALRGQPVPPAASVALPHRPRRPQLRAVEADVELTGRVS